MLPTSNLKQGSRKVVGRDAFICVSNLTLFIICSACVYLGYFVTNATIWKNCWTATALLAIAENFALLAYNFKYKNPSKPGLAKGKSQGSSKYKEKLFLEAIFFTLAGVAIFYMLIIFFGAPVLEETFETFNLSLLLSALTFFPSSLVIGCGLYDIVRLFGELRVIAEIETLVLNISKYSVFGAWLGAFAIPLDWDRPWQKWPMPCIIGIAMTLSVYHLVTFLSSSIGLFTQKKSR